MPSPIRGRTGSAMYIEQGTVLRTLSHYLYSIYPWHRLTGYVVELLSTAPHKRNFGSSNGLKIELKTQELYALLARG